MDGMRKNCQVLFLSPVSLSCTTHTTDKQSKRTATPAMRMQGNRPTAWFPNPTPTIAFRMSLKSFSTSLHRQHTHIREVEFGHRPPFVSFWLQERKNEGGKDFLSNCCLSPDLFPLKFYKRERPMNRWWIFHKGIEKDEKKKGLQGTLLDFDNCLVAAFSLLSLFF
jgi:hypothetical protein